MPSSSLPTGTVTFLLTDVEGSTKLWERFPEEAHVALTRHDEIIDTLAVQHRGSMVRPRGEGDSRFVVFSHASDAIMAAAAMQRSLYSEQWPTPIPVQVRMALHTGEGVLRDGDYYGSAVNRCARLRAVAHGGQTLISQITLNLARDRLPPGTRVRNLGVHRLRDLLQPEQIFQLVVDELQSDYSPLKTVDVRPNNLPNIRSHLVGREAELTTVKRLLLRDDVGLLTLTGTGGIGKTRLASQVATDLLESFPDGSWFVSLAHITDSTRVVDTIAHTLGVNQVASRAVFDTLADYLSDKYLLLVLDNFEQVVAAAPLVVDLLAVAPHLKVLVTSREVLRVHDEQEFAVPPLGVPDLQDLSTFTMLAQFEAVALFIQRARLVNPDFDITPENARAIAEICHRLDGLPLAIELAAARIRHLTPDALLSRLTSRLRLLTSGSRELPERHQTLRSTIKWSYDLLRPPEQLLFQRMAMYKGGGTLEAIEAVCNADGTLELDVLDGVASLVDKSLVRQISNSGSGSSFGMVEEPRFGMLETIREFAVECLVNTSPTAEQELFKHFAQYYLSLAEQGGMGIRGNQQDLWLSRLDMEYANLQAVGQRAIEQEDAEMALRLGGTLREFWLIRGYSYEGVSWLQAALGLPGAAVRTLARARALLGAASTSVYRDDWASARDYVAESVSILRDFGPEVRHELGLALASYGSALGIVGEREAGVAACEEGEAMLRQSGHTWNLSFALFLRGLRHNGEGNIIAAQTSLEESLTLARDSGNMWVQAQVMNSLGDIERLAGDIARARGLYEESLHVYRRLRTKSEIPALLHNLGHVALTQGDMDEARRLFIEALYLQLAQKNKLGMAECLAGLAGVAGTERHPARAARLFSVATAARVEDGGRVWPAEQAALEHNQANARLQMDHDAWEMAWQEGRAMTLEQAISYALEEYPDSPVDS